MNDFTMIDPEKANFNLHMRVLKNKLTIDEIKASSKRIDLLANMWFGLCGVVILTSHVIYKRRFG